MSNFNIFSIPSSVEINTKMDIDMIIKDCKNDKKNVLVDIFNNLNINKNENKTEPNIIIEDDQYKDSIFDSDILINALKNEFYNFSNENNEIIEPNNSFPIIIPKIFYNTENFTKEPFSIYHIKTCNIFKQMDLFDYVNLKDNKNLFKNFQRYLSDHLKKTSKKKPIQYIFNKDTPIQGYLDAFANSNILDNYLSLEKNISIPNVKNINDITSDAKMAIRDFLIGIYEIKDNNKFVNRFVLKKQFSYKDCKICICNENVIYSIHSFIDHLTHLILSYTTTNISKNNIIYVLSTLFKKNTCKHKLPKDIAMGYIKLKNKNVSSYIRCYNTKNTFKYRIYLKLNTDTLNNCRFIKNKLSKYPYEKEIRVFGNYYLNTIQDIKKLIKDAKYIIKLDISKAYASVDISKLFNILIADPYISEVLTITELKFCFDIYNKTYLYDNTLEMTRHELYLGVPLSTIFFQIYMNYIIKSLKEICIGVQMIVFVDDILIYGDDCLIVVNHYNHLLNILDNFKLVVNINKTKLINTKIHSLIFLNRILISNNDKEEFEFIKKFMEIDEFMEINKFIVTKDSLETLMFMNLDKFSFNNIKELKYIKNLIIQYSHILKANDK